MSVCMYMYIHAYVHACVHVCVFIKLENQTLPHGNFHVNVSPSHKIVVFYYALEYSDEKHYKSMPKTRKAKKEFSRSLVLLRMANHIPHSLSELRQHLYRSKLYSKMANSCTKPKCQDLLSTYSFLKNN